MTGTAMATAAGVPRLVSAAGADPGKLRLELEAVLGRRPRVTGPGVTPGQLSVTRRA